MNSLHDDPIPPKGTFAVAFLAVTLVRVSLRALGLRSTVKLVRRLAKSAGDSRSSDVGVITEKTDAVSLAAVFFPGRAECLERSLASFLLLRRAGVPVDLRIGVQAYPFVAHAWLELLGKPVGEHPDIVANLVAFPELYGS